MSDLEKPIEKYMIPEEPYYRVVGNEEELFKSAYEKKIPVILKGPTGCGKTRFLQYMAYKLSRPLITIACHEDLTSSDLVGRYIFKGNDTVWAPGPLTLAVTSGGICYLDEVVEARKDTIVIIHPLTDFRRILPLEKKGTYIEAADGFLLVISYNPGYQTILKDLKQSTRQRFITIAFDYPPPNIESEIIENETGIDPDTAEKLVKIAGKIRNLKKHGLDEGVSTRLLMYCAELLKSGLTQQAVFDATLIKSISDDEEMQEAITQIVGLFF